MLNEQEKWEGQRELEGGVMNAALSCVKEATAQNTSVVFIMRSR